MKLWMDAQLSPALAPWINESIPGIEAVSLKWLGMHDADDLEV
jgi:predicted nuclease of predicted toxin-antitoxin system